jgi:hypothetical protein
MLLLRKAMLFDRAEKAKRRGNQRRSSEVKAATPPGATTKRPPVTDLTRAKQRLAKTGRVEDAASAFLHILPD